ncbi:Protein kinase [Mycena sanguinolenta]|uniref:non-specific serine/threonine protein kinase n=1 Tax=Mycena sanguinolenta TaxID=230812 RepID=A0A8H6YYZ8_9AGAR|nr:Protein kinase [Mycena sanguinolenta]
MSSSDFPCIPLDVELEKETIPNYVASHFYPVHNIGDIYASRYKVVGKLGCGRFSTSWLARDLNQPRYVTLKVSVHAAAMSTLVVESSMPSSTCTLSCAMAPPTIPGATRYTCSWTRSSSPVQTGEHQVFVQPPFWLSVAGLLARRPSATHLPKSVVVIILQRTLLALTYIHDECGIVHTNLKEAKIMFGIAENDPVLQTFEREDPLPRKVLNDGS